MRWTVLCVLAACSSTRVVEPGVLLCGPQPDAASLRALHRLHGVKTVVNLRGEEPGRAWFEEERRAVSEIGARWVHLKTSSREPPAHLGRFFDLVEDRSNWPILVHCQSGVHRTGLMCALYRIQYQGWSNERAWREMVGHGFRLGKGDRAAAERYVKGFKADPERALPSAPGR